jgi:DNA-directed RNA polymerase subunit RPC12/RpoP
MRSKEYYEKRFEKDNEVSELEEVVCPYCFLAQDDEPSVFCLERDRDREDIECEHCKEKFRAEAEVQTTIKTTRK